MWPLEYKSGATVCSVHLYKELGEITGVVPKDYKTCLVFTHEALY